MHAWPRREPRAHTPQALVHELRALVARLDYETQLALKESLYRISRNTYVRVTGAGAVVPRTAHTAVVDRVVANLLFNKFRPAPAGPPLRACA